jgi:hypothetical protein
VFQKELNPPVIQVTEPTTEVVEMDAIEDSATPMTPELPLVEKSRNPFLSVDELMREVGSENGEEEMLTGDKDVPLPLPEGVETNPFRKLSGEHQRSALKVADLDEMNS